MTEQDFLALEPRARDALVAEKVMGLDVRGYAIVYEDEMGCVRINDPESDCYGAHDPDWYLRPVHVTRPLVTDPKYFSAPLPGEDEYDDELKAFNDKRREEAERECEKEIALWGTLEHTLEPVSRFTFKIQAAWDVVERMREDGDDFFLENWGDGEWTVANHPVGFRDGGVVASAPTAPLAICIAALKAVGAIEH